MPTYKKGDLYLASIVHVNRGTNEHPEIVTIQPGQMASETDLSAKEIESLKVHRGVLRAPTFEEMQAMDAREEGKAAADAAKAAEEEQVRLAAEQKAEKDRLAAEQRAEAEKERQKLEADQAKERDDAAKKAAGSGKGSKR